MNKFMTKRSQCLGPRLSLLMVDAGCPDPLSSRPMIKCTNGDLDKLRDAPTRTGPLSKLMAATEPSIVDKFRISKLVKAIEVELLSYGKALADLGKKYGDLTKINDNDSYQIRKEEFPEFLAEKKKLDDDLCEVLANPLPVSALEKTALTALDVSLLEPFVVAPTDV